LVQYRDAPSGCIVNWGEDVLPVDSMRILHLDDSKEHSEFLAAQLQRLSDDIIVHHAVNLEEAERLLALHKVDCLIVDDSAPDPDGPAWREKLRKEGLCLPVIVLSDAALDEKRQYIESPFEGDRFTVTIAFGRFDLILQWAIKLTARYRRQADLQNRGSAETDGLVEGDEELDFVINLLTPREREILALVTLGYTNQEIADALYMSYHTAKNHIHHIFEKLQVSNRAEAVRIAMKSNIVK
jgi:DNA-binding NarL/FixJ family response regulator